MVMYTLPFSWYDKIEQVVLVTGSGGSSVSKPQWRIKELGYFQLGNL